MNSRTDKNQRPEFFAGETSAEAIQKQFIERPMAAAQQSALNLGLDVFAFMSRLPDALIDSEQREFARLSKTIQDKNDPRLERLKASIDRATDLRAASQQGKARIDRVLVSLSSEDKVFHGFVSDTEAQPLSKLTVRIFTDKATDESQKTVNSFSGTTNADGYFSIPLGSTSNQGGKPDAKPASDALSQRIADFLGKVYQQKANASSVAGAQDRAQATANVEILDAVGTRLYLDPFELPVDNGSVYREYIIESRSGSDTQRYAGNPATRELHDTQKLTKRCNFEVIEPNRRIYFESPAAAEKAGYDYCAYCFGKAKSKR